MSGFVIDTNCISELVRPRPQPRVIDWMEAADESMLYLSVLKVGEIRKSLAGLPSKQTQDIFGNVAGETWLGKRGWGNVAGETWLEVDLQTRFAGRILAIDGAIADRWGLLAAEAKRTGKALPIIDGLLAATALHHNLTVVLRNASGFTNARVQVLNPWKR
jgi:predicted nucleic acid-binding protein